MVRVKVAVVSFIDPRATTQDSDNQAYTRAQHAGLLRALDERGFQAIDPMPGLDAELFGLRTVRQARECAARIRAQGADCLVLGCWHWTDPMLLVHLVKELDIPVALYTQKDMARGGTVLLTAGGASLWETRPNRHALTHQRFRGDFERLVKWLRGVGAVRQLNRSSMVLWGGSYSLHMEQLQDDIPRLKSFLVGDIVTEGEYFLIKRAEQMSPARVDGFIRWLQGSGVRIELDSIMLTNESLRRQVALYLAAKDRLAEWEDSEPMVGASIKCQHELSGEYGVSPCLVPAFLPFPQDSEGPKPVIPTVCEGDIKGLVSSVLLHLIAPEQPPLFGDFSFAAEDYILISNCGAASAFYAGLSGDSSVSLPGVTLAAQSQGASGGAVGFHTPAGADVAIGRLVRVAGQYYMQMGLARTVAVREDMMTGVAFRQHWPTTALSLGVDPELLVNAAGSNHWVGTVGDRTVELQHACVEAGIPVVRIDSNAALETFNREIRMQGLCQVGEAHRGRSREGSS